ncbi:MAG: thioredoxin domain-containing protein [Phormidesmis sp.]
MISTTEKQSSLWKLWTALVVVLLSVWATILLTRPAATPTSMTPLSGLMTLKSLATEATPYEAAIANTQPTFIEFYADWCTTCQSTAPTVKKLHQQYGSQINFVMLNIDDPKWATQVADYSASGVPQFTLLAGDEQPIDTWVGKVPKAIFTQTFEETLAQQGIPTS